MAVCRQVNHYWFNSQKLDFTLIVLLRNRRQKVQNIWDMLLSLNIFSDQIFKPLHSILCLRVLLDFMIDS